MMEEVARVRLSLNSRIEQLENDCRSNRVSVLEKELSGQFVQRHRSITFVSESSIHLSLSYCYM